MTHPVRTAPGNSLRRMGSDFLKRLKKSRPPFAYFYTPVPETELILPAELWLDILENFSDYELEPLSRVCRRLRWIVLPLYFRSQQLFPFAETFAFRRLSVSVELAGYEERSLQRMEFLFSQEITSAVRDLYISPYPPGYNRRHRVLHREVEAIMQPLISGLPRFQGLRKLVLQFPMCNDALFAALAALNLDSLELEVLPTAVGIIPIPVQGEFFFNRNTSPIQLFPADELSLRFLFPEAIERIVAGPTGTDTLTRSLISQPSRLTSLTKLDLSILFAVSPHFVDALSVCPNLSSLRLRTSAIDGSVIPAVLPPLPAQIVPRLTSYHGPAIFTSAFSRGRTLRIVRLWASHSVSTVTAPWLLIPILQQLGDSITSLELGVTLVPEALLETLHDAFPALTNLSLNAHLDSFHPGTVARRVLAPAVPLHARLALPAGLHLKTLRLGVQLAGTIDTPTELYDSAKEAILGFPREYDPTSWRRWIVDRPWYVVGWTREDVGTDFGTSLDGTLRIEYGEHYFCGFQRGERISARTVDEAAQRLS